MTLFSYYFVNGNTDRFPNPPRAPQLRTSALVTMCEQRTQSQPELREITGS